MLFLCTWLFLSYFELVLFFEALPLWQCCRAMYVYCFDIMGCFSFNVASPATSSGNGDIYRTSGKVTKLKQGWLQLKNDTYLQIWSIFFLAMHSFDVFYSSRTNCSYRNPGFVEYDNLNTMVKMCCHNRSLATCVSAISDKGNNGNDG